MRALRNSSQSRRMEISETAIVSSRSDVVEKTAKRFCISRRKSYDRQARGTLRVKRSILPKYFGKDENNREKIYLYILVACGCPTTSNEEERRKLAWCAGRDHVQRDAARPIMVDPRDPLDM